MNKTAKTNAARLLDAENIEYKLIEYEVDESDLSAAHVAKELGQAVELLFKTLIVRGNKTEYFVCIVPGDEELDLKKAAKVSQNKKCEMIPMKDLLPITGYVRGACSPLGMKKEFPKFIHSSCIAYDLIYISAGKRGMQIRLNPKDLIRIGKIEIHDLIANTE